MESGSSWTARYQPGRLEMGHSAEARACVQGEKMGSGNCGPKSRSKESRVGKGRVRLERELRQGAAQVQRQRKP